MFATAAQAMDVEAVVTLQGSGVFWPRKAIWIMSMAQDFRRSRGWSIPSSVKAERSWFALPESGSARSLKAISSKGRP